MGRYKYSYLLSGLVIIFACSCNRSDKLSRQFLQRAGQLIEHAPDSALHLLEDSVRPGRLSRGDYADWCLLTTQARDKNYLPHTSDSLIRVAVDYYENHKNPSRLMLAYYEMGRVLQEMGDAPQAQTYYRKALKTGETSGDNALLARIYSNLGMLYLYQSAYSEALPYMKQAEYIFRQTGDTVNLSFSLRDMARAYSISGQLDSSIAYYNRALLYVEFSERPFILNELGSIYLEKGDIGPAYKYVKEALEYDNKIDNFNPDYLLMGKINKRTGNLDSAKYYLNKEISSPESNLFSKAGAYYDLYHIAKEEREWEKYTFFQEEYERLQDSIREQTYTETILKMESLYNYEKAESEAALYKLHYVESQKKILSLFLYGFILSAFCIALLVYYQVSKSRRKKEHALFLERLEQKIFRISSEQIDENLKRMEKLKALIKQNRSSEALLFETNMLKSVNNWIKNIMHEKSNSDERMLKECIYKKLHSLSTSKITDQDYIDLHEVINSLHPGFYPHLHNFKLSTENIQTASMIKARLSQNEMTRLLGQSNTVSMRLKSLARKLLGKDAIEGGWKDKLFKYISDL